MTASCSRPFVHTKLPPSMSARPSTVRPPAAGLFDDRDRARRCPTARRSDRSRCRTRLRRRAGAARSRRCRACASNGARASTSFGPMPSAWKRSAVSHANESCASSSAATDDTVMRSPSRNAPRPRPAHQRMPSAGADATPTIELARVLEPDQRRPDRHAAHVALRAVDRVDDPPVLGVVAVAGASVAELLAEHGVIGRVGEPRRGSPARRPGRPRSPG